ncbi:MAG: retropepsin-like aspartic protease [Candidatus Zambryskibacteria bacterium]|nr:retropepsin-like aspartic protease [Candidatus Zambryskibacteria bacterium]
MKFDYKRYGQTLRPVMPIKLLGSNGPIGYEVLVDSGADMCIFHAEIGEALGIDIKKGKPREVFGVGGKSSIYYLHTVTIEVGGWEYEIEGGFMSDVSGRIMPYGIVGQRGFFSNFIIKFDLAKEEIELKKRA